VAYLKVKSWHSSTGSILTPGMYGGERYPFWQYKACQIFLTFLFIHLVVLSYDRSKASSKASSPHSAIQSFLLQMTVSSPFLKVIQ
jgi:hypothetical protein